MIGKHYLRDEYNCAHFVAEWYEKHLGVKILVINEFERSFLVWMRNNFTNITSPDDHCLVLMKGFDGGFHIGVYHDFGVWHNFKPVRGHGSVCKWTLSAIRNYYTEVSFHKWLRSDTSSQRQAKTLKHTG